MLHYVWYLLVKRHTDVLFWPIDNCNVGMADSKLCNGGSLLDRGWDAPRKAFM
jgi:hypothetical protein